MCSNSCGLCRSETLYEIWAQSGNPRRCYLQFELWPFDLEHVSRVALCSEILYTKFKLGQAIRSRNVTIFSRLYVISWYDLDLWPLDLELLWYFGLRVSKACVKFERNREIRGRVIHDLAHFRPSNFWQGPKSPNGSQGCVNRIAPNSHRTQRGHCWVTRLFQPSDILLRFETRAAQSELCWKRCQISHFFTSCKN